MSRSPRWRQVPPSALLALLTLAPATAAQTTHVVDQLGDTFVPAVLSVQLGDTVEFRHSSGVHTVTEGTDGTVDGDELFHSPLDAGTPVVQVRFDAPLVFGAPRPGAAYDYFSAPSFAPGMTGTVFVHGVPLVADTLAISLASGGTQNLSLQGAVQNGGKPYLIVGSASGTQPGFPIDGLLLPLNADAYSLFTIANANSPVYQNTLGVLTFATVTGFAAIFVPPGLPPALAGLTLHHAFLVFDVPGSGAAIEVSNAVPLTFLP